VSVVVIATIFKSYVTGETKVVPIFIVSTKNIHQMSRSDLSVFCHYISEDQYIHLKRTNTFISIHRSVHRESVQAFMLIPLRSVMKWHNVVMMPL